MSVLSNMAYACEYVCENTSMKEGYEGDNNLQQGKQIFLRQCVTGFRYLAENNMEENLGSNC